MSIRYFVRKVEFYSQEGSSQPYSFSDRTYLGEIHKEYESLEQAHKAVKDLTVEWLRNEQYLTDYKIINDREVEVNLFCKERCGIELIEEGELPPELTNKDVLDLAELLQIELYKALEINDNAQFYAVWISKDLSYFDYQYSENFDDLVNKICESHTNFKIDSLFPKEGWKYIVLKGALEDISHSPDLLKKLIENNKRIMTYSDEDMILRIEDGWYYINILFELNSLLKKPYIDVRKIDFQELIKMLTNVVGTAMEECLIDKCGGISDIQCLQKGCSNKALNERALCVRHFFHGYKW
jgi:hypothetical protein